MPREEDIPSFRALRTEFERLWEAARLDVLGSVMLIIPVRIDAEEIVQQTATILWEKFDSYNRNLSFTAWACGVSRNVARRWATERDRWRAIPAEFEKAVDQTRYDLQAELDRQLRHLDRCLDKLPKDQGLVVRDYYYHKLGVDEIADFRKRSVDSVYKILQRSLKKLQDCIVTSSRGEGAK